MSRPLPVVDAITAPHFEAAAGGELLVPECDQCQKRHFPPEARCPFCQSSWHWTKSPGTGTVYTYSVVWRGASPHLEVPYVLAVVELDDGGWTMTTNIVGCPPESVHIGMRVASTFEAVTDDISVPLFAPR